MLYPTEETREMYGHYLMYKVSENVFATKVWDGTPNSAILELMLELCLLFVQHHESVEAHFKSSLGIIGYEVHTDKFEVEDMPTLELRYKGLLKYMEQHKNRISVGEGFSPCMLVPLLMAVNKRIPEPNYSKWLSNRYRAFLSVIGESIEECMLDKNTMLSWGIFSRLGMLMGANKEVRKDFFLIIINALSQLPTVRVESNVCSIVKQFAAYAEMGHVPLIIEYLINRYQEMFAYVSIKDEYPYIMNLLLDVAKYELCK